MPDINDPPSKKSATDEIIPIKRRMVKREISNTFIFHAPCYNVSKITKHRKNVSIILFS